ncbi:hypothetical protein niasHT_026370 [Heterodera trifolii]|uniref:Homeobox domain-containing protein n=1 Tax=Heterodera trifolii TaxID=157864 RepID=A0ABD2KQJ8_9BILA
MQQQNYSADQLIKLENEFSKTMCPSASAHAQLAKKTGLTEKQIEQWFERRRTVWKRFFGLFLDAQCDIEENENALQKYNAKRQNIAVAQLDKLEEIFGAQKYLSVGDMKEYAMEIGLTDNQVEEWFEKRRLEWKLINKNSEPINAKIAAAIQKVIEDEQNAEENAKDEEWFNERRSQWKWKYMKCDLQNAKLPPIYDKISDAVQKAMKEGQNAKAEAKDEEYYKRRAKNNREEAKKRQQKRAQQQNFSADHLDKLEREFEKRNEKMAKKIGLTEPQVKMQQEKLTADQLDKFELKFGTTKCPNASDCSQLAIETGLTEEQIKMWFKNAQAKYSRHNNKEHQSLMMLKQNTAFTGAKVCVECGQRIVHQTVPQSQPNAIDITSVGCTSVSAVRGRAKCRRLFWRAVTFPMNAVAELVKKMRSAKCALANKVKKGKNEKK